MTTVDIALPKTGGGGRAAENPGASDSAMSNFCDILQKGFASVSEKLSEKLDNVGTKMSKSVEKVQKSIDHRMEELSRQQDHEVSDSDCGMGYGFDAESDGDSDVDRADSESVKSDAASGSFFKKLNKPPPAERVGEKVNEVLAEATDRFFRKPISHEEFKELKTKYVRPENVNWLRAPDIPPKRVQEAVK